MSLVSKNSLHNVQHNAPQLTPCTYKQCMQRSNSRRSHKRCSTSTHSMSPLWSSDEPSESSTRVPGTNGWGRKVLVAINESTKWTVSATVMAVLLWLHNEYAAWCVIGAVLSSVLCKDLAAIAKVLKRLLNHERPDNAPKSDPGMPSSHANSLNFLSVYAALSLLHHTHGSAGSQLLAAAALTLGVFKTWLRVHLGFHTWPQVLVGAGLGATSAITWFSVGNSWALPALQQAPGGLAAIYVVTGLGSAAFAWRMLSGLGRSERRQLRVHQEQDAGHVPTSIANREEQAHAVMHADQGVKGVGLQQASDDQEGSALLLHAQGGVCTPVAAT